MNITNPMATTKINKERNITDMSRKEGNRIIFTKCAIKTTKAEKVWKIKKKKKIGKRQLIENNENMADINPTIWITHIPYNSCM